MLQTLRDKSSGWIATVILGLLIIPFAFFGVEQYMTQSTATYAAKIEAPPKWWPSAPSFWPASMLWQREEIGADEFRTAFEQQRQQLRDAQGDAFDPRAFESADNKRRVLEGLVDRRIMRMMAVRDGVYVSDAQLRGTIESIPAFQVGGRFDAQTYQIALASQNQSPRQFEQVVRDDMQQTVVPNGVAASAFVTRSEVDRLLRLFGETRDAEIVTLPAPEPDTAPVSDADAQRWFQQRQAQYRTPETVTLEILDVDGSKLPPPAAPSEQALKERYDQEKAKFGSGEQRLVSHILVKDEKKAQQLAAQAKAPGADFAALARANSEDTGSKAGGGDLGWIQQDGTMVKPFEDAVFAMKAGDVSGPVKSDFGYHVIQLREIKPGTQKSFDDVRDQLAAELADTGRERAFNDTMGKLVDEVYKNPTTLEPAARLANLPVRTVPAFARVPSAATAGDPVLSNPAVLRSAFSESLIQDGTVSDPVEIAPGHSVLLRVKAHQPERAQSLDQVRDRVVAAVRADRARKAAVAAADALIAEVRKGKTLEAAAAERKLPLARMPGLPRGQPLPDPMTNGAIFEAPAPAGGKPALGKSTLPDGRIAVFAVSKVTPADPAKATPEQVTQLQQQLSQVDGVGDVEALVRALRSRMKVTVAEDRL